MKNLLKTIGVLCAGGIFLILCLILFCIDWVTESFYKIFFPKKWEKKQKIIKINEDEQKQKNLSRGWAYQPNIFGEH